MIILDINWPVFPSENVVLLQLLFEMMMMMMIMALEFYLFVVVSFLLIYSYLGSLLWRKRKIFGSVLPKLIVLFFHLMFLWLPHIKSTTTTEMVNWIYRNTLPHYMYLASESNIYFLSRLLAIYRYTDTVLLSVCVSVLISSCRYFLWSKWESPRYLYMCVCSHRLVWMVSFSFLLSLCQLNFLSVK